MRTASGRLCLIVAAATMWVASTTVVRAQNTCLAGKTGCVNQKVAGLLKCRAACQKSPAKCGAVLEACETKVRAKFEGDAKPGCFAKLEAKAKPDKPKTVCVTTSDAARLEAKTDACVADLVSELEGGPPVCACFPATGQQSCWDSDGVAQACPGTGQDGAVLAGAPLAYHDNGDGTITDLNTGLMWEKLLKQDGSPDAANPHDADNTGTWSFAVVDHPAALNLAGFAGYHDWRAPNVKELASIVNHDTYDPPTSSAFQGASCGGGCADLTDPACSCTAPLTYWTSTTSARLLNHAWGITFDNGGSRIFNKTTAGHVRAVRGGS